MFHFKFNTCNFNCKAMSFHKKIFHIYQSLLIYEISIKKKTTYYVSLINSLLFLLYIMAIIDFMLNKIILYL